MHIYFAGIGGAGLHPLALMARDCGFSISGSDAERSAVTEQLESSGASIGYDQDGSHIQAVHEHSPIDWVVASSAIPADSPELGFAHENDIKVSKRDEFVAWITEEMNLDMIAVTGTHGKTSTTAMCVWILQQSGIPVSYVVGSGLSFGPPGRFEPGSQVFVYEADEYDRNFLYFSPTRSIITTCDYDHPDIYPTEDEYRDAFRQFIDQSGRVYIWDGVVQTLEIDDRDHLETIKHADDRITLIGQHNRENASLALEVLRAVVPDTDEDAFVDAINDFPGAARRMERLAENIYTDYAHHPAEIAATIQAATEAFERIVIVYQPHQNVRQYRIRDQYARAFDGASRVYWLPTYLSREDEKLETLDQHQLMMYVDSTMDVQAENMNDDLAETVRSHAENGDTVIFMGAGSIDVWAREQFAE